MARKHYIILIYSCFLIQFSVTTGFLNAQSGWEPDVRLTYFWGDSDDPRAACNGDTVHLVWREHYWINSNLHEEVFYKRSTDAGVTWSDSVRLTTEDTISSASPNVAVWENNVHVIWYERGNCYYALCYRKSTDSGETWGIVDTLRKHLEGGWGASWLAVSGINVYVVFNRGDGRLIFMKSTDNGSNWSSQTEVGSASANPRIDVFTLNDSCLVTCASYFSSAVEVFFYKSTDAGVTWSDSQCVSHYDSISSQRHAMDTDDSGGVHVVWYDYKYSPYPWTGDIFYRSSRDSGSTWELIDSLTVEHRAFYSDILAEGTDLHLVWMDDRHDFDHNFEIYYRMSTDLGQTWGSEVRLTYAPNWSSSPSLACDGRYLHLFWSDAREDTINTIDEIYYKRKDLLVPISEEHESSHSSQFSVEVWPNPFTADIYLRITGGRYGKDNAGKKSIVSVKLYDIAGQLINTLVHEHQNSGFHTARWDGRDAGDREVSNGIYFIELKSDNESITKKVIKLR
ncbi:MAG: exo-alpha-sialidase [Thermoplasmata archaeon]|nr:exo-alpha-sialidase [Thermoplasmata archaeon]